MNPDNRKRLRDALVERTIKDIIFIAKDDEAMHIHIILDNNTRLCLMPYKNISSGLPDFYVLLGEEEL